jgi:hypothetical protein
MADIDPKPNAPVEGTDPREIDRDDVGSGGETIPLPVQDPTPEVVEEGDNPVKRWIRRLRSG